MKLGYLLEVIGFGAVIGGLVNTIGGCLANMSLFADPFRVGASIGTLCLGCVLFFIGSERVRKAKKQSSGEGQ